MAPNPKIKRVCDSMKLMGIQEVKVKSVLKKLLKTYDNNWNFIQDENYKVLLDCILEDEATEKDKMEEKKEYKDVAMKNGKKKALTPAVNYEEDDDMDEDETPLNKTCGNRFVQRGLQHKLQKLSQGAFVCEYIGEIMTIIELYQRSSKDKLTSPVISDAYWGSKQGLEDNKALCLDVTRYGNISRFLNHRCLDANLIEIPVLVETPDQHYYYLAFFTTRDIEAMEELTWDYGIDFDDGDYLMKPFDCLCGSRFCRNKTQSKKAKKVMNRA